MAIFRVEHNTNYTVISNRHLRDRRLSLKAKGLLTYMLSCPNDWDFSLSGLTNSLKEGMEAIRRTLAELKENGYLGVKKARNENGNYYYIYYVYEHPKERTAEEEVILSEDPNSENKTEPTGESEAIRLSEALHDKILANKPNRKIEKKWRTNWSLDIEKLHRIDKRDYRQIEAVLNWSQNNEFWRTNILSGKKLREKFDRLEDEMQREIAKRPKVFDLNKVGRDKPEPEPETEEPEPEETHVTQTYEGFKRKIETPEEVRQRIWGAKKK